MMHFLVIAYGHSREFVEFLEDFNRLRLDKGQGCQVRELRLFDVSFRKEDASQVLEFLRPQHTPMYFGLSGSTLQLLGKLGEFEPIDKLNDLLAAEKSMNPALGNYHQDFNQAKIKLAVLGFKEDGINEHGKEGL